MHLVSYPEAQAYTGAPSMLLKIPPGSVLSAVHSSCAFRLATARDNNALLLLCLQVDGELQPRRWRVNGKLCGVKLTTLRLSGMPLAQRRWANRTCQKFPENREKEPRPCNILPLTCHT